MPELSNGSNRCECTDCGEMFNSVYAFDKHRVFENPKVEDWDTRRCLRPAEMQRKGWGKNAGGFWITSSMPAVAR